MRRFRTTSSGVGRLNVTVAGGKTRRGSATPIIVPSGVDSVEVDGDKSRPIRAVLCIKQVGVGLEKRC